MGIDKITIPNFVNIVMDNNPAYIKELKEKAEEDGLNEEGENRISLTMDKHNFEMEEYYFEDSSDSICISGTMTSSKGQSYVSIEIPLSDIVLIDILQHSIKKLNKLKTVLETLK